MDVDKSLDDIIAGKRQPKPQQQRRPHGPRHSAGNTPRQTPYARPPPRSTSEKWTHDAYRGPGATRGGRSAAAPSRAPVPLTTGSPVFSRESPRIEIIGLHYEVSAEDLKSIFSQAGEIVTGPTIVYDRSGRSTGSAWMEYANVQQAKIAINKFDGAMTKGQTISIRFAVPRFPPSAIRGRPGAGRGAAPGQNLLSRIQGAPGTNAPAPAANNKGAKGTRGARGGRGRGGNVGGRPRRQDVKPGDLDKELDSFMKQDAAGDVEMS
ncbi:hypothetical protein AYX13_02538 [Cryptococcus neoformans]|nr:hypothetical protein AYX13_02538 [Cryptococcus neoformans var. grubii]